MSEEHPPLPGNGVNILMALIWPGVAFLSVLMLCAVGLVLGIALTSGADANEIIKAVGQGNAISKLVTILVIVPVVGILALTDKVSGSAALTVLGTIAGFMIGGLTGTAGP